MNGITVRDLGDGRTQIRTPYYQPFARQLGCYTLGTEWTDGTWVVQTKSIDKIRQLMLDMFGYNDQVPSGETVCVKISFPNGIKSSNREISLLGKTLYHNGRLGRDVGRISGRIYGNELHQNINPGSEFLLRNVPQSLYMKQKNSLELVFPLELVDGEELEKLITSPYPYTRAKISWKPPEPKREVKKEQILER